MVMPSAFLIIAVGLGGAFLLGFLRNEWRATAFAVTVLSLASIILISSMWLWGFAYGGAKTVDFLTAGIDAPFAINLRVGLSEATLVLLVGLTGLFSAIYLKASFERMGKRAMAVLLIDIMALCGIILTRDIFNMFVFFELVVISTGGLILLSEDQRALAAGFKYLIVSQFISLMFLLGTIFIYHSYGTLNIDGMTQTTAALAKGASLGFFLLFIALVTELKPFPANGWALDIYEAAHPAFSAIFSAAVGTAALFAVNKTLQIGGDAWLPVATGIGIVTFVVSNILALQQTNDRRLLGYSSIAQVGLVLVVIGQRDILGDKFMFVAGGILLAHAVAKAGLYWLSGMVSGRELQAWTVLRKNPIMLFAFITFIAMLSGLPPFPGFYAKWELAHALFASGRYGLIAFILFGALVEAGYLFRWFGFIIKREMSEERVVFLVRKVMVVFVTALGGWWLSYIWGGLSSYQNILYNIPFAFALAFMLLEWLPAKVKNTIAIIAMCAYFYISYPSYDPLQLIFGMIILLGGAIVLLASYNWTGRRQGFYTSAMLMYAGLSMLIVSENSFSFFVAWELLTVGSYFLMLRGKNSEPHALSYIVFSLGGAFAILSGFALAAQGIQPFALTGLGQVAETYAPWVFILLAIGFMTKTAAIGLHIWLPGAHAEAEADVSPMVSGILLKAGLFGLFVLLMNMGKTQLYGIELTHILLWMGALSAFLGNLMAIFQEDAKRLLAYSSIGQMGYALFGLAMMNHLGWLMALLFVINHYIYKSMLFLSVGGIAKRTGTRNMFKMGGLIALMPLSFIAVLVGIIAMSGVPPLSGFGGRWIFYNAIMTVDYRLPIVLIFLSGPIAFLYLFRLIHTIFLGQLKDEHRKLKEVPFWLILPQMLFVIFLLGFAVLPGLALRRVDVYISKFFADGALNWDSSVITSNYGYWNPVAIMIIIGVIFVILLAWLVFLNRKAQKVKQFNIVYAAERPYRPETTHYAWNFFASYRKAMGFLVQPIVTSFWDAITGTLHSGADVVRRIYTGNGQTYAYHFLAFVVVVFMLSMGV